MCEIRTVVFDPDLNVEAYRFVGIMQKFPNHFHDYYVIGFIEQGKRLLSCNRKEYIINSGDVVIFNLHEPHACEQVDGRSLDYRCINIEPGVMRQYVQEITGTAYLPRFSQTVLYRSELAGYLHDLHQLLMEEETSFHKEEMLLLLIEQLLRDNSDATPHLSANEPSAEIRTVCEYMESHFTENITLNRLSELTGLSKYHLLRSFTKQKGISPYSYLETIRINQAKRLLEWGVSPMEAALKCGFSDQSHFTKFFKRLIGLTPKQYMRIFENETAPQQAKDVPV
ncbi:AraC family ligand binding domain-containing protein [Paenibacillus sp. TH7-28]